MFDTIIRTPARGVPTGAVVMRADTIRPYGCGGMFRGDRVQVHISQQGTMIAAKALPCTNEKNTAISVRAVCFLIDMFFQFVDGFGDRPVTALPGCCPQTMGQRPTSPSESPPYFAAVRMKVP